MSIHKSLKIRAALIRSRNVLTRFERIAQLRKSGRWKDEEASPFGLAKVRVLKVKKRGKEKKEKKEEEAKPAAGAAPAAGGKATAAQAAPAAKAGGAKK